MYGYIKSTTLLGLFAATTTLGAVAAPSVAQLEQLAASNDAHAQYQLGLAYETGEGVNKDKVQATKWYRAASNNGHRAAQFNYAQALELGVGVKANPSKAALLYTQLAISGEHAAYPKLGHLYSQFDIAIPLEDQAVFWYSLASKDSAQYQQIYDQALQRQFNAQQRRQINALQQQEKLQQKQTQPFDSASITSALPVNHKQQRTSFPWLMTVYTLVLVSLIAAFITREWRRRQSQQSSEHSAQQYKQQIEQQQQKIKQLAKHIKLITERYQHTASQQPPAPEARLQLAYARFGFDVGDKDNITTKDLKLRYKKLSRIYHPDTSGSEEEMKQLNLALDTILNAMKVNAMKSQRRH